MEIRAKLSDRTQFSPWSWKLMPFTETSKTGEEITIPRGTSLPELARIYYGMQRVDPFSGQFPFLDRDHKERVYDPAKEDPFVFNGKKSISEFHQHAKHLHTWLVDRWEKLGLPTKTDEKRNVKTIDSSPLLESTDPKVQAFIKANYEELSFITSNVDICLKFCIVRGIIPGWWASSYAGKETASPAAFKDAIDVASQADRIIRSSATFKSLKIGLQGTMGDPLYSNVGYPFFVSTISEGGAPVARLAVLDLFEGLGTQGWSWKKVVEEVDRRAAKIGMRGHPFAVAAIRRQQAGAKLNHNFNETSWGLTTQSDFQGYNTIRVAFIVPYLFNLLISPLAADMKAVRMMKPGCYNDGPIMRARAKWMRSGELFMAEGDYSNYDRSMPYPLLLEKFKNVYSSEPHFEYWKDMFIHSYKGLPMIWPDYVPGARGRGYIFQPGALGLLSGIKHTSDIGTDANALICIDALLSAGIMSKKKMLSYLTRHVNGSQPGSEFEYFNIQSDDAILMSRDYQELLTFGHAFKTSAAKAGIPLKFEVGDRYLMRHMSAGRNAPVPARIWQNTISNEDPYIDPLKFIVGLASRTDGLLGFKTVDAFANGSHRSITEIERSFSEQMLLSIMHFIKSAAHPVREAIAFVQILIDAAQTNVDKEGRRWKMSSDFIPIINEKRRTYVQALAKADLALISDTVEFEQGGEKYKFMRPKALTTMFMQLRANQYSMSSLIVLDELVSESADYAKALNIATEMENQFYKMAIKKLDLPMEL